MKVQLTGRGITGVDQAHYFRAVRDSGEHLPTEVCLGRIQPKARPQALRLASYLKVGYTLPTLPVDWATKAAASISRMYLNDQRGTCTIADSFHRVGVWTANESGVAAVGTDAEVLATYQVWNPGNQDNGCVITDVLDYCRDHGISVGGVNHKIDGYVSVDWTNWDEVLIALFLFGTLPLGVNLPQAWLNSDVWDVTNSPIVGGHDVPGVAVKATLDSAGDGINVASWSRIYRITKAVMKSKTWIEECWAPLSPDWYAKASRAPNMIAVDDLRSDLAKIGGGIIPDIGPVTPPTPGPQPMNHGILHVGNQLPPGKSSFIGMHGLVEVRAGNSSLAKGDYVISNMPVGTEDQMMLPFDGHRLRNLLAWIQAELQAYGPTALPYIRQVVSLIPLTPLERLAVDSFLNLFASSVSPVPAQDPQPRIQ